MDKFIKPLDKLELNEKLHFQILTWEAIDEHEDIDDEDSLKVYRINLFGVDSNDRSVCLRVDNFTPFYYVKIPKDYQTCWTSYHTGVLKEILRKKFKEAFKSALLTEKIVVKGFRNKQKEKFLRLTFSNFEAYNKSKYYFYPTIWNPVGNQQKGDLDSSRLPLITSISTERLKFDIFEHNIEPFIRFSHIQKINMADWVEVEYKHLEHLEEHSRCKLVYSTNYNNVKPSEDNKKISNFINCSFDIECTSETKKGFPDYKKEKDIITQIGATFIKYNGDKFKYISTIKSPIDGKCSEVPNADLVEVCNNEIEVVEKFVKIVEKIDPDFISGYNTYDFDWKYIYNRCKKFNKEYILQKLSRLDNHPAYYRKERLSSAAYGDNYFEFIHMYGVTNLDLRVLIKRDHKLDSYTLNNVSKHFLNDQKDDLPPQEIFEKVEGTKEDIAIVCKYCIQDTELVANLFVKLKVFSNIIGMSNVSKVPINYVELKGQQIKVFSQLLAEAREEGYIVPTIPYNTTSDDSVTGATVLTAKNGAYYDPIAGLDFASLYPSIMIAFNYCYTTIVDDEEFDNLPNVEYKQIEWVDSDGKEYKVKFVQNVEGLLPKMLNKLWNERKKIKKLMKTADSETYAIYDGQQLAIKVSMNSIYGFTGATYGRLPDKRIASAVTAIGRHSIEISKNYAEENYDCEVIYGDTDSIYVKFNTPYEGKKHFDTCFKIAQECADKITHNLFKKPMELEFEKMMYPFYLFTKKRYATLIWTNPDTYDYIDYKGIQIKRRDSCEYVKNKGVEVFETLLLKNIYEFKYGFNNNNIEIAKDLARKAITDLISGKVPIDKLIVSKAFREGYSYEKKGVCPECDKTWCIKDENGKRLMVIPPQFLSKESICPSCNKTVIFKKMLPNLPHVALAEKMKERDPFNCPVIGDRVPYVFIVSSPKAKQFEKVEDPKYAINNLINIDYMYYFEHQLKSVFETIFEVILDDISVLFKDLIPDKKK
jgi:DNA polymerase delta subunit 1